MIAHLDGELVDLQPGQAVVSTGGVGYEVRVPLSAHPHLAGRQRVALWIHTHVREDQLALFGFPSRGERDAFRALIAVSGVGPRMALALLSGLSPEELALAIDGEQWRRLAAVPGIGRRTAERLIVELKGKFIPAAPASGASLREDAVSALVNLGYASRAAEEVVSEVLRAQPEIELGELLRRALQSLTR
jgi:Holliday junction DNA helicase RuvA